MENIKTKVDLYRRIKPALEVKLKDIKFSYQINIKPQELFDYLEKEIWLKKSNLSLSEIVEDIFQLDINQLFTYVEKRRSNEQKN